MKKIEMKKLALLAVAVVGIVGLATFSWAGGNGNGSGNGNGNGQGQGSGCSGGQGGGNGTIDTAHPVVVAGTVVGFNAAAGEGTPTLVVKASGEEKTFVLGPYWYLAEKGFKANAGDSVEVKGYPCTGCANGLATAEVKNLTQGVSLSLRDEKGLPLWTKGGSGGGRHGRGQGGHGNGMCQGSGPDMARVQTIEGTVRSFTGGPGAGQPTLVVSTASGDRTVVPSPYRTVVRSGFSFAEGKQLAAKIAPVTVDGVEQWVVISLRDLSTGLDLVFRDATTGKPAGGCGRK
jgi:hypothetical protein